MISEAIRYASATTIVDEVVVYIGTIQLVGIVFLRHLAIGTLSGFDV